MTTTNESQGKELEQKQKSPVMIMSSLLNVDSVKEKFQEALAENSGAFITSLLDLYTHDSKLQECKPNAVISTALTAATLKLPINKSLGFAWIIPRNKNIKTVSPPKKKGGREIVKWVKELQPHFQLGYKGYVQLAMRTGEYRNINAGPVYEGEFKQIDRLSGVIDMSGEKKSDTIIGYFAYFKMLNGFEKTVFATNEEVVDHARKFSWQGKEKPLKDSAWDTDFDAMAQKTLLTELLSKWGMLSIEMVTAMTRDADFTNKTDEEKLKAEIIEADAEIMDIEPEEVKDIEPEENKEPVALCPNNADKPVPVSKCDKCKSRKDCPAWDHEKGQKEDKTGDSKKEQRVPGF
jgi:recombination protein RecT